MQSLWTQNNRWERIDAAGEVNREGFKCDYCKYKNNSTDIIKEHMKMHKNGQAWSPRRRPCNSSPIRIVEEEMDSAHLPTADDPM